MSSLVWYATLIYATSMVAGLLWLRREMYRADFDVFADEAPALPGSLDREYTPLDPEAPIWAELKARAFAKDVLADIATLPGGDWRGDL